VVSRSTEVPLMSGAVINLCGITEMEAFTAKIRKEKEVMEKNWSTVFYIGCFII
jgi:hypothetical protein